MDFDFLDQKLSNFFFHRFLFAAVTRFLRADDQQFIFYFFAQREGAEAAVTLGHYHGERLNLVNYISFRWE